MNFKKGSICDLGTISLTEREIIRFAKEYDPIPFHLDRTEAKKSIFGTIVASGPHLLHCFYTKRWLPLYVHTIKAGLELNAWKLQLPVFPTKTYRGHARILSSRKNIEKAHVVVNWKFEFFDHKNRIVQHLSLKILHLLNE